MSTSSSSVQRPVVLPDTYSGDGNWSEWKYHFENVALVNEWSDEKKLQWLRVRLTGRAQKAIQHLTADAAASFSTTIKALDERFEPKSRRTLHQAEFQARRKKKSEGWAEFADDLKTLVEKGYPELQDDAKEQLALQNYLRQFDPPQVAFSVKQKQPKNVDEAVAATIEMESYLSPPETIGAAQCACGQEDADSIKEKTATIAPVSGTDTTKLVGLMERLLQRVERLEQNSGRQQRYNRMNRPRMTGRECWACGEKGHFARNCPQTSQGNGLPSTR